MLNKRAFLALMVVTTLAGLAPVALAADRPATPRSAISPIATSGGPQLSGPTTTMFFVGTRLLNIFRAASGVGFVNLPTPGGVYRTHGINDGPDGVDPLGVKDTKRSDGPAPANTPVN